MMIKEFYDVDEKHEQDRRDLEKLLDYFKKEVLCAYDAGDDVKFTRCGEGFGVRVYTKWQDKCFTTQLTYPEKPE